MSNWITHDGGPMPVSPDTVVQIRCLSGHIEVGQAKIFDWSNYIYPQYSITEYRIIEEPMKTETPTPNGLKTVEVNDDLRDKMAMEFWPYIFDQLSDYGMTQRIELSANYSRKAADAMLAERGKR